MTERPQFQRGIWRHPELTDKDPLGVIDHADNSITTPKIRDASITAPKLAPGVIAGSWELIRTGTFTNSLNITGLNGNADKLWMLVLRTRNTSINHLSLRFNDFMSLYVSSQHSAGIWGGVSNHAVVIGASTSDIFLSHSGNVPLNHFCKIMISSLSGQRRLVSATNITDTDINNSLIVNTTGAWGNTVDNIHTINILIGFIVAGEFWLFRRRV